MESLEQHRIADYKSQSKFYVYSNFVYTCRRLTPVQATLACAEPGCEAVATAKLGERLVGPQPQHDHPAGSSEWVIQRNELFQHLKVAVPESASPLIGIYESGARRYPLGASHLPYEQVISSMRRWRRSTHPPIPDTLSAYGDMLAANDRIAPRYLGTVSAGEDTAVILVMDGFVAAMRDAEVVAVDATFQVTPQQPPTGQLLTVHCTMRNHFFHVAVVLMERRTHGLYLAVLRRIWSAAGDPPTPQIVTDYEQALQTALMEVVPTARVVGCYFHFVQALVRNARRLQLGGTTNSVQERNSTAWRLLRLYAAIATLQPQAIRDAVRVMQEQAQEWEVANAAAFHAYFMSYWMGQITPERFSVHGVVHRTNNTAESFHATLARAIVRHPNVWALTEELLCKLSHSSTRYAALVAGRLNTRRNMSRDLAGRASRRLQLLAELAAHRITLRQYLTSAARMVEIPAVDRAPSPPPRARTPSPPPRARTPSPPPRPRTPSPPPRARTPSPPPRERSPLRDHDYNMNDARPATCSVCFGEANITLVCGGRIPEQQELSGHLTCTNCLPHLDNTCPVCRQQIRHVVRMYY